MKINFTTKIILIFFASSFLFSCSKKNNDIDFDFSTLKKSKKVNEKKIENKTQNNQIDKSFIKDLITFEPVEKIQSKVKYGKKILLKRWNWIKGTKLNLELNGIVNTKVNKFALVNYLNKEGTITENSIGGLNTNLLPKGAKVINIDTKRCKYLLTIKWNFYYWTAKLIFNLTNNH